MLSMSKYQTFYHYTDAENLLQIKATGVILSSHATQSSEGLDGPGIYLTRIDPGKMKGRIINNSYDGMAEPEGQWILEMYNAGKVHYFIEMKLKTDMMQDLTGRQSIFIFHDDINLRSLENEVWIGKVGGKKEIYSEGVATSRASWVALPIAFTGFCMLVYDFSVAVVTLVIGVSILTLFLLRKI